jgi:hypothetical protein
MLPSTTLGTQDIGHEKDQTLTLPSGAEIPFRVIRPDDAPALQRLHSRFFGLVKSLSDEKARYFASTDGVDYDTKAARNSVPSA